MRRDVLDENFFSGDVEIILKTKNVITVDDFWCWKHSRSGEYTVRSGNWLASKPFCRRSSKKQVCNIQKIALKKQVGLHKRLQRLKCSCGELCQI